jgi:hypothetical protein
VLLLFLFGFAVGIARGSAQISRQLLQAPASLGAPLGKLLALSL